MALAVGGVLVTPSTIPRMVLNGGDTGATIVPGTDIYPSTRGMHTLMAYLAPMDKYYDDWAGRVQHALGQTIEDWRTADGTMTQASEVDAAMGTVAGDVHTAFAGAVAGIDAWKFSVAAQPLPNQDLRLALDSALATVDAAAIAIRRGEDLYIAKVTDVAGVHDKWYKIMADQGSVAARTMGDAVQYTGQALDLNNRGRVLAVNQAQFDAQKEVAQAQLSAKDSSSMWGAIGKAAGIVAAIA